MRPEDLADIIDGIDDDIILDIPELNGEEPLELVIESKAASFWKAALSAACLLCVLVTGAFAVAKIRTGQPVNSGANAPASIDSTSSPDSTDKSTDPENRFSTGMIAGDFIYTQPCVKENDFNFAVVYIDECSDITEEEPVYISIWLDAGSGSVCVSETLKITRSEPKMYIIKYTRPCLGNSPLRLRRVQGAEESVYNKNAKLSGHWIP